MINRIDIRNVATYIEPVTIVPKDINFIGSVTILS